MSASPIHSSHLFVPLMYRSISIVFLLICNVHCDIFTLDKYSHHQTLKTIDLGDTSSQVDLSEPGRWERVKREVTEKEATTSNLLLDRSVLNGTQDTGRAFVHWIGKETSEKLVVLSCSIDFSKGMLQVTESHLWCSDDYGSTFYEKDIADKAKVSFFYTAPTDSKKLIFTDINAQKVYTTSDELQTFQSYDVPVNPDMIKPHPFVKDALLLYSLLHRKLYSSMNFGKTWSLLSENVLPTFYWASEEYDKDPLTVHMEIEGSVPAQATYKACIAPECKDVALEGESVGPFLTKSLIVYKEFMFVQKSSKTGSEGYLMVSYKRKPFQRAYFPGNVKTIDFVILSLDNDQVFVGVNHGDKVNLYLSDETGHFFVLSLTDVSHQIIRPFFFGIDLHEVQGMNWTYMANAKSSEGKSPVNTYISFDKGGNWVPLQITEEMKKDCKSADDCNFKLLIRGNIFISSIMSNENAPGIILAHGILGSDSSSPITSVFTSRDGGWTWKKAPLTGMHRFNILDQGSVLSAIPDGILSNKVSKTMHYSLDEGDTWTNELFDSKGLIVKGVLTEPNILTLTEMVFGNEGKIAPWTLVKLNFSSILTRRCEDGDFESWYPRDYNSKLPASCTLGRKLEYKRRKQSALCHNGEVFIPRFKPNDPCECVADDYECDFGYEEEGNNCKKAKWFYDGYLPSDCEEGSTYYKSQGYRKIPGNSCVEKEAEKKKYDKVKSPCSSLKPHGLLLTSHNTNIITGKESSFFLEQAGGSRIGTAYTWNFGDASHLQNFTDYVNASSVAHIFTKSGHYNVSVTAENSKGKSQAYFAVHVQDQISSIFVVAPKAGKTGQPVKISVTVTSLAGRRQKETDHIHYVWTFGDETPPELPTLSWSNTITHSFKKAGSYDISIEAVNSVSSLSKPLKIKMFDDAIIMVLTFSTLKLGNDPNPEYISLLLERLWQQLIEDLGVNADRIEVVLAEPNPVRAHLFIFPSDQAGERTAENIKDATIALVKSGEFGINMLGRRDEPGNIFKVDSITSLDADGDGHGPNMTPVYIAAPVLIIVILSSVILFFYCRRKVRNVRQFNLLNTQDDSDALLDDDDEAPLDLDIDFGVRETNRDDHMLDSGNHLVMVTGERSDRAENC